MVDLLYFSGSNNLTSSPILSSCKIEDCFFCDCPIPGDDDVDILRNKLASTTSAGLGPSLLILTIDPSGKTYVTV